MKNKIILAIIALILVQTFLVAGQAIQASPVSSVNIINVDVSPSQIQPGQTASINLEIRNSGDDDLEDIVVSLDLTNVPFAPYESSSSENINELLSGKTKNIRFDLVSFSTADSGIYKLPVQIKINGSVEISYISLTVNSKPILGVESENYVIKERNNDISLKIINSGLSNAKFLSITADEVFGVKIISQKYSYIGDVDSNDFNSVDLKVFVSKNAPGIISLPVKVNYKDSLNKDYEENFQVSIRAYTQEEAINLGLASKSNVGTIIFAIIILIVLYLIYRAIRKRLKKKKEAAA